MVVRYNKPEHWIKYDPRAVIGELVAARAAILSLRAMPYQKEWAKGLQEVQLKIEAAGTSRIEGAVLTDRELDIALRKETAQEALTRSQRQARAAATTYHWIADLPNDYPLNSDLVSEIHRRIVTGCDDDHCPPGALRSDGDNVTFGAPLHRGAEGGAECKRAFEDMCHSVATEFRGHDMLVQALALHYHLGAMHPFLDGNGRTARAMEALMLQRTGLRDDLFISMSNYYYEEKPQYLGVLGAACASDHDLTQFLQFGLRGIAAQCNKLLDTIRLQVSKTLFRDVMFDLFNRLKSTRRRVIALRQIEILKELLKSELADANDLFDRMARHYKVANPWKAYVRDLNYLINLRTIWVKKISQAKYDVILRLEWATEITQTEFFERIKTMPKSKTSSFLE